MCKTICGADCGKCSFSVNCGGCAKTSGNPFGGGCMLADCKSKNTNNVSCKNCIETLCSVKSQIIEDFNSLNIPDMEKISSLNALAGFYVNLCYYLPNGEKVKLLNDGKIYLGNQVCKSNGRCYGLVADEQFLLVCEYGANGENPDIIIYKKR